MRKSKPITVTLGNQQAILDAKLASGEYDSASEVVRAGLRALDREQAALDAVMRARIEEALADPRPAIPAEEVFARLERKHAARLKALGRDR
jgi:antitoxin ParD1/3/4